MPESKPGAGFLELAGMLEEAEARPKPKRSKPEIREGRQILSLAFAKIAHPIHEEPDLGCPLCLAEELEASAEARYESLRGIPHAELIERGRLLGALARNAGRRLELAEALREGSAELISAERSEAWGLSLRWRDRGLSWRRPAILAAIAAAAIGAMLIARILQELEPLRASLS